MRAGKREKLDGHTFAGIRVEHPFSPGSVEMPQSKELYLSSCIYLDDQHWRAGWNDSLQTRHGCQWSKWMVLKSDVAPWWPSVTATPSEQPETLVRTGAPGPAQFHASHRSRTCGTGDRGEAHASIAAESRE